MFRNPLSDGVVVLLVLLLFFGPKRLPALSRSIGESIKEFRGGIASASSDEEEKPALGAAESTTAEARQPAETGAERSS